MAVPGHTCTFIFIAPPAATVPPSPLNSGAGRLGTNSVEDHSAQVSALTATHSTPRFPTLFPEKGAQWADEVINAKDKSTLTGEAKEVEQEIELCKEGLQRCAFSIYFPQT